MYSTDKNFLVNVLNERCDDVDRQDGKTLLNFTLQITVLKIGKVPGKIDRTIHNAETEAEGFILIESIFN